MKCSKPRSVGSEFILYLNSLLTAVCFLHRHSLGFRRPFVSLEQISEGLCQSIQLLNNFIFKAFRHTKRISLHLTGDRLFLFYCFLRVNFNYNLGNRASRKKRTFCYGMLKREHFRTFRCSIQKSLVRKFRRALHLVIWQTLRIV